jgi:Winged helix-turn helix
MVYPRKSAFMRVCRLLQGRLNTLLLGGHVNCATLYAGPGGRRTRCPFTRRAQSGTGLSLLHRHDCRKLAPNKRHPKSDPVAQAQWKKTPRGPSQIRKDWAQDQPIKLICQDEARFGRISEVRRCWATQTNPSTVPGHADA